MIKKSIWISWENHRRTQNIVDALGIRLFVFKSNISRWIKHPLFLLKTLITINREKPNILFVQNPSVVLTLFVIFIRCIYKYKLVVDSHNVGLYPFKRSSRGFLAIYKYMQKGADITIVTNSHLSNLVKKNGGRPYVLPDKIPTFGGLKKIALSSGFNVVFICTFAIDEPYEEVVYAAKKLPEGYHIYITGNNKKVKKLINANNITYTGFLSEDEYKKLLYSADAIIDLTTMDDALLCGAYESVALNVPLITSDTIVIKEYFYKGVVYTDNDPKCIAKAIIRTKVNRDKLREDISALNKELQARWDVIFNGLIKELSL